MARQRASFAVAHGAHAAPAVAHGERINHCLKKLGRKAPCEFMLAALFSRKLVIVPLTYFVVIGLLILVLRRFIAGPRLGGACDAPRQPARQLPRPRRHAAPDRASPVGFGNPAGGRAVALYQAGADCHVLDPLDGFLTTEEMRARDELVLALAHRHQVPLAWDVAGGYQRGRGGSIEPALALHRQFMVAPIEAQVRATSEARVRPSSAALPSRGAS